MSAELQTHQAASRVLCGTVLHAGPAVGIVELDLIDDMKADASGLVHGGFIFGAADLAAMVAVNHPNVVLGSANVRFLRPSRAGEKLRFEARVVASDGRKRSVSVVGRNAEGSEIFNGSFDCFVPDRHVLEPKVPAASPGDGAGSLRADG